VLVLVTNPTFPGCIVTVRPIGMLRMEDDNERDDKILAVPIHDPRFNEYKGLDDPPKHILDEIAYLFKTYKELEGKHVEVIGWQWLQKAKQTIIDCQKRYTELV
jgi:inorganic pyrophosphatase